MDRSLAGGTIPNPQERHKEDDFPIVRVDDKENIVDMPEEAARSLSTEEPASETTADGKPPIGDGGNDRDTVTVIVENPSAEVTIRTTQEQTQVTVAVERDEDD